MPGFEPYDALGAGEYTITIAIDLESARSRLPAGPCPGYPVELSSRTYNARVTEGPAGRREVNATSPTVARESGFSMFVEGDRAVIDGDNDGIREDFPGFRVLTVWVGALPTDPRQLTSGASTSIPVTGEFRYCELKSALGAWYDCSQVPGNQILAYHSCTSDRVLMTFTKR